MGIRRGPLQKEVWTFAKALARRLARKHPQLITAEYLIAKRPRSRVLVEHGFGPEEFTLRNVPGRIGRRGDLWKPLLGAQGRFALKEVL